MEPSSSYAILGLIGAGFGTCFGIGLLLYNLVVLIQVIRESTDEKPSVISMVAWAISFVSLFLGPCGLFTAFVGFVVGRVEQGRIYSEKSSVRSTRPCEMATINSLLAFVFTIVLTLIAVLSVW